MTVPVNSEDGLQSSMSPDTNPTSMVLRGSDADAAYEVGVCRPIPHLFEDREDFKYWKAYLSVKGDFQLLTRAWVFQEQLLPPRVLHFSSRELTGECNVVVHCEYSGTKFYDVRILPKLDRCKAFGGATDHSQLASNW